MLNETIRPGTLDSDISGRLLIFYSVIETYNKKAPTPSPIFQYVTSDTLGNFRNEMCKRDCSPIVTEPLSCNAYNAFISCFKRIYELNILYKELKQKNNTYVNHGAHLRYSVRTQSAGMCLRLNIISFCFLQTLPKSI